MKLGSVLLEMHLKVRGEKLRACKGQALVSPTFLHIEDISMTSSVICRNLSTCDDPAPPQVIVPTSRADNMRGRLASSALMAPVAGANRPARG